MVTCQPPCTAARHGDESAYSWWACRCPEAREAWRLYKKRLREGRQPPAHVHAVGTARRLQALVAYGYTWRALATHLGVSPRRTQDLASMRRGFVHRDTAARVRTVYDRLSLTRGGAAYALTVAARYGWLPPLAWDDATIDDPQAQPWGGQAEDTAPIVDEVAIRRALNGERVKLTRLEKHHAVHHGVPRLGVNAVATALHLSGSTIRDLYRRPLPAVEEVAA
jgi:AraC-like DNA-binding protein